MSLGTAGDPVGRSEALDSSRIPGAFPEDDVAGAASQAPTAAGLDLSSKNGRNKLHKPSDPRGWDSETLATAQGHRHTDSGVGLPEPDVASKTHDTPRGTGFDRDAPANATRQPQLADRTNPRSEGLAGAARQEHAGLPADFNNKSTSGSRAADDRTAVGAAPLAGEARSSGLEKDDPAGTSEVPYWGDLPRGGGVYNTVIGHGSREEQEARRLSHERDARETGPAGLAGAAPAADGQRAFPLVQSEQTHSQVPRSAQHAADAQYAPNTQRREQDAPSAHQPAHSRLAQNNNYSQGTQNAAVETDRNHQGNMDDATRAATIAYAGHSVVDDRNGKQHAKEHHPKQHHPKQQHEAVFVPVASDRAVDRVGDRTIDDQSRLPGQPAHNATTGSTPKYPSDIEAHHSRAGPAVASAAAGGAAAYGASRFVEGEEHTPGSTYGRSTETNPSQSYPGQSSNTTAGHNTGNAKDVRYDTLSSGTPSGVNPSEDHTTTGTTSSSAARSTPAGELGTIHEPTGHSKAKEAAAFGAVGAGAAGAYEASRAHDGARNDSQYETLQSGTPSGVKPDERAASGTTHQRTANEEIPRGSGRATGAETAVFGSAAAGGAAAAHASRTSPSKEGATTTHGHSTTGSAHNASHDQYNHLASGTPSGINLGHGQV